MKEPQASEETADSVSSVSFQQFLNVPLAILLAALMISGSILYVGSGGRTAVIGQQAQQPAGDAAAPQVVKDPAALVTKDAPVIGSPDAKVTLVEFSDFECPFCRQFFQDTYGLLKKDYIDTGKVRMVYRHFPLPFHESARPGALAGQCANEQGKFWQFHDKLFGELGKKGQGTIPFSIADLKSWAAQVGLNTTQFNACLDSQKYAAVVDADIKDGTADGVSGTPSFFINGQLVVGAQPYSAFQNIIEKALEN